MRRLRYIVIETGRCQHCGRDAGEHGVDGICNTGPAHQHQSDVPEPCFRNEPHVGFVDLDSPEFAALTAGLVREVQVT